VVYSREAHGSMEDVTRRLEEAVAAEKFGILGVHDLKQKMNQKGVTFRPECRVFDVCNPQRARTVLEADMTISTALPCRISVYEEGGAVKVSALRPTLVLGLFGRPELQSVAEDVEAAITRIIDAACGKA